MSPTDTDLESLLMATLRAKAAQVPEMEGSFDPALVTLGTGDRRRARPPLLAVAAVVVIVIAVAAGFAVMRRDVDGPRAVNPPAGAPIGSPVARIEVRALPTLTFQAKEFRTLPGINEISFTTLGGTHHLVFADPALSYFSLSAPSGPSRGKVLLRAGRDYTIYCSIPGHRAAGMEAVIHVTAAPR